GIPAVYGKPPAGPPIGRNRYAATGSSVPRIIPPRLPAATFRRRSPPQPGGFWSCTAVRHATPVRASASRRVRAYSPLVPASPILRFPVDIRKGAAILALTPVSLLFAADRPETAASQPGWIWERTCLAGPGETNRLPGGRLQTDSARPPAAPPAGSPWLADDSLRPEGGLGTVSRLR